MTAFAVPRKPTAFSLDPSDKAQKRIKDDRHLAFIRTLPSVLSGSYGCEACHIRYGDPMYRKKRTGRGQKPDDAWTVPLTPDEHREQHSMNEVNFWNRYRIDPLAIAQKLYEVSGDKEAALAIIKQAHERKG